LLNNIIMKLYYIVIASKL